MIVLINICMAIVFFSLGALTWGIVDTVCKASEEKRAAEKALKARIEKLEELLESNLDKNEK